MNDRPPAIQIENVCFGYEGQAILDRVDLTVDEGDFLGIIGPNGSGKTTLLRMILGLLKPGCGGIRVFGRSPEEARHLVGYIPQHAEFDREFPVSAWEVVLMGRLGKAPLFGKYREEDYRAAEQAMRQVEVYDLRRQRLGTLSGGQLQRVLIARALASRPRLLLMDEPTASVDTRAEKDLYRILRRINQETTIVLVTHDLGFVSSIVKRVACLNRNLVCHPTSRLTSEIVEELYHGPVHVVQHEHVLHVEASGE